MTGRRVGGRTIDRIAFLHAMIHVMRYRTLKRLGLATFLHAAEAVAGVGFFYGYRVRRSFYEEVLAECGRELEMNLGATIAEQASCIGNNVWVGPGSYLDLVNVGDDVLIGPRVTVLAGGGYHRYDDITVPIRRQGNYTLVPTIVGDGVWIGAGAVILADIGDGAVIGAGSVVIKPVEPLAIVAGNPARTIGTRDRISPS